MNGFSYRKKITVDKSKVIAKTVAFSANNIVDYDLVDFPVLLDIIDKDLIYTDAVCGNKIQDTFGRDISFALATAPAIPLNFQIESYDRVTGKLTCWIRINALAANKTTTPATAIYLYYGSSVTLHNPFSTSAQNTWNSNYTKAWHMNMLRQEEGIHQLKISSGEAPSFPTGIIGQSTDLTEMQGILSSAKEESTQISISGWLKLSQMGIEQTIFTNDSLGRGGFALKINSSNKLLLDIFRGSSSVGSITGGLTALTPGIWHHFAALFSGTAGTIYLNGIPIGSGSSSAFRPGAGGSIKIGASRAGTNKFKGQIDELRIQKISMDPEWLKTEYANQSNPGTFYSISNEEYNPLGFYRFTGSGNQWNIGTNWNTGTVPPLNSNIVIAAGKSVIFQSSVNSIAKLIIEAGATLTLSSNLDVNCIAEISSGGLLKINDGVTLSLASDVYNDGGITTANLGGKVRFSGNQPIQKYGGTGAFHAYLLEHEQFLKTSTLVLNSAISLTGFLTLKKGIFNSNGQLTLISSSQSNTAAVLPVQNLADASIIGTVNVQQTISGDYPAPATARGWRLLSSPVTIFNLNGIKQYGLHSYKGSMFVTGSGGSLNGFDPSPQNGGTIYIHDQSLAGTLSQKYIAVKNIQDRVPTGRGVYVFSRGDRNMANAYAQQVQPPFAAPGSYKITYTGALFTGDLQLPLKNRNSGGEGDGFNLLGNPYAAPLRWGSIYTENVLGFIWQFDPLNNAYVVSDSPDTFIPSGTGFFVRVASGQVDGSVTFTESSKYTGRINSLPYLQSIGNVSAIKSGQDNIFNISIQKGSFKQHYLLKLKSGGNDEINDADALKIGDGLVSIHGMRDGVKLAIEEQEQPINKKEVTLGVKGFETGEYILQFISTGGDALKVTLRDDYLNKETSIIEKNTKYVFNIDKTISASEGEKRFKLIFETIKSIVEVKKEFPVYPNPFTNKISVDVNLVTPGAAQVILLNVLGHPVITKHVLKNSGTIDIDTDKVPTGIYFLLINDEQKGKILRSIKILKN